MSQKPRNIGIGSLIHYHFPLAAIISILHRLSGVLLFVFIPFILLVFSYSMHSSHSFMQVRACFNLGWTKLFLWLFFAALIYHIVAGVKHLLLDMGFFESQCGAKVASMLVLFISIISILLTGAWMVW